jgi:hypothetical protein
MKPSEHLITQHSTLHTPLPDKVPRTKKLAGGEIASCFMLRKKKCNAADAMLNDQVIPTKQHKKINIKQGDPSSLLKARKYRLFAGLAMSTDLFMSVLLGTSV